MSGLFTSLLGSRDPHKHPILPPPFTSDRKVLIVLTNAPRMQNDKPCGYDIRDVAHFCEILYTYVYGRERDTLSLEDRWTVFEREFFRERFAIVSVKGGEAPMEPAAVEWAKMDLVTNEFMKCKEIMDKLRQTERWLDYDPKDVSAVFFPGGHGPLFDLATYGEGGTWIRRFVDAGGYVAAVCHGPAALLSLTIERKDALQGKKLTCFSNAEERAIKSDNDVPFLLEDRMRSIGAQVSIRDPFDIHVVADGPYVTGQNTQSVRMMTRTLIKAMSEERGREDL